METERIEAGCTLGEVELSLHGDGVFVLSLLACAANPENRWTTQFSIAVHNAFDAVEAQLAKEDEEEKQGAKKKPHALLTLSESPKFFSNGIPLEWLTSRPPAAEIAEWNALVMPAFARPLLLPIPTVCAVQGHAFGAGFMFALAHDALLQRTGRKGGFMCAPEVAIGVDIPGPELALFAHQMPVGAFHATVLRAKRWTAEEASARGVLAGTLDGAAPPAAQRAQALAFAVREATSVGRDRHTFGSIKRRTKGYVAEAILAHEFPGGAPKGRMADGGFARLPAGLRAHVREAVVRAAAGGSYRPVGVAAKL